MAETDKSDEKKSKSEEAGSQPAWKLTLSAFGVPGTALGAVAFVPGGPLAKAGAGIAVALVGMVVTPIGKEIKTYY